MLIHTHTHTTHTHTYIYEASLLEAFSINRSDTQASVSQYFTCYVLTVLYVHVCARTHTQAMVWFAGEYLSTMCEHQRPESPAKG